MVLQVWRWKQARLMNAIKCLSPESAVKEMRRQTRRKFSAEEKIRIALEGLKG